MIAERLEYGKNYCLFNKLTLRFVDKKDQSDFQNFNATSFTKNRRIALIVSIFIYLFFSLTDYLIIPDVFIMAIAIRIFVGLFLGIGSLVLSFFKLFHKYGELIIGITVLLAGSSVLYMILSSQSSLKNYYYFGYYIAVLISNVFFRQSFLYCVLWSSIFALLFEIATAITLEHNYLFILNHLYFYSSLIMLLVNSYHSEKHRIMNYILHKKIENQNEELQNSNKELDSKITQKTQELEIAFDKEKKANILQQTFLSNISHQIRTPLNAIIGITDKYIESQNELLDLCEVADINDNGKELLRMIEEIVLYSKIEAKSIKINNTEFSLEYLLKRVTSFFTDINKKEFDFQIEPSLENNYFLYADYDKLLIVLNSLIFDAYKRVETGSISLKYTIYNDSEVKFIVSDSAEPLSEDLISKILSGELIQQNKLTHSEGFGISLTNKLCNFLGTSLIIANCDDGNTVSFSIICKVKSHLDKNKEKTFTKTPDFTDLNVLVVEDIALNFKIIAQILIKYGAIVERAEDGLVALKKIKSTKYDIILMDIQMPNMDGIEATKKIRSLGIKTPVIAQTANILADDKIICLQAGCNDYIGKPINSQELLDVIIQYI